MIQKTQCLAIDKLCKTRGSSKNAEPPECKVDSTVRLVKFSVFLFLAAFFYLFVNIFLFNLHREERVSCLPPYN